jgi:parallel beta-helix repeat protein
MSRKISLLLLAFVSLTAPSWASIIYVSGDQTGTWSADTVIVTAEVRVPPGQSLTISPGVEVLFLSISKLIVESRATLRALGTALDSIRFDVLSPNVNWRGIRFLAVSDSCRLEHCILAHGQAAGGGEDGWGGAIYCSNSDPTIISNRIWGNSAAMGGAIACVVSSPQISGNNICRNSANGGGGIYCGDNSNPSISGNTISDNSATSIDGGGIYCINNSNPSICNNDISGNAANMWWGGGIICYYSSPAIEGNVIRENSASDGGGIFLDHSSSGIVGNTFCGNTAAYCGGGIYCYQSTGSAAIRGNTFSGNSAIGSGIYCYGNPGGIINCILWGNSGQQISWYVYPPPISYSNVQGFGSGGTNIDSDPLFINAAQGDYRLQWGSPCIDSGDPNPIYNDPDGTRADMGAWYCDQSSPVRILLTPYNAPIQIPASGGSFDYAIQATNIESTNLSALVWCNVTLPSGTIYGPVLGPVIIEPGAGQTLSRVRTQAVPAGAPAGMYHYNAYAVAVGDTSEDNFVFTKAAAGFGSAAADGLPGGWTNTGEKFASTSLKTESAALRTYNLELRISPNPFNPITAISYQLSADSYVSLKVYDTAGRLVTELVNGWREAGGHEVTFDGSALPSGIYFAKLEAGNYSHVQKMVLLK